MTLPVATGRSRLGGTALLVAALVLAPPARTVTAQEIIDRVLAVVAGDLIMLSDVAAARDLGLIRVGSTPEPNREILTRLIDRALVLAEVERYAPPEPAADEIDLELAAVHARFPAPGAFAKALERVGIDERHLRLTLRQDLRIATYLDQRFSVPLPSDDELGRFYRDNPKLFTHDGALVPFEQARREVIETATADRRRTLVEEWVAGLRRRAEIIDLYPE